MNSLKALLITGLISLCSPVLHAGNPVTPQPGKVSKPTEKIHSWCEIRGVLEKVADSDGNLILICRMVADNFCYSIPCMFGMPVGNKPPVKVPVPQGVNIEEGQNFLAYYDEQNKLKIILSDKINSTVSADEQGIETLTVKIAR